MKQKGLVGGPLLVALPSSWEAWARAPCSLVLKSSPDALTSHDTAAAWVGQFCWWLPRHNAKKSKCSNIPSYEN